MLKFRIWQTGHHLLNTQLLLRAYVFVSDNTNTSLNIICHRPCRIAEFGQPSFCHWSRVIVDGASSGTRLGDLWRLWLPFECSKAWVPAFTSHSCRIGLYLEFDRDLACCTNWLNQLNSMKLYLFRTFSYHFTIITFVNWHINSITTFCIHLKKYVKMH